MTEKELKNELRGMKADIEKLKIALEFHLQENENLRKVLKVKQDYIRLTMIMYDEVCLKFMETEYDQAREIMNLKKQLKDHEETIRILKYIHQRSESPEFE